MIQDTLTPELQEKIVSEKCTLIFEVIDPVFDPHIEKYSKAELVLLGVVKNQLEFEQLPYEELQSFIDLMQPGAVPVRVKRLVKIAETFNDFWIEIKRVNSVPLLGNQGIEGYVIEDSSAEPNFFKIKTDWYSFWKRHRTTKDKITSRVNKKLKRRGDQEPVLDKQDTIKLKTFLHTEEDIIVFNHLKDMQEKDFELYQKMQIIACREFIVSKINAAKEGELDAEDKKTSD